MLSNPKKKVFLNKVENIDFTKKCIINSGMGGIFMVKLVKDLGDKMTVRVTTKGWEETRNVKKSGIWFLD
jgi:hypothetical protein